MQKKIHQSLTFHSIYKQKCFFPTQRNLNFSFLEETRRNSFKKEGAENSHKIPHLKNKENSSHINKLKKNR